MAKAFDVQVAEGGGAVGAIPARVDHASMAVAALAAGRRQPRGAD